MEIIFLIGVIAFVFFVSKYGILLSKIRTYLKENKNELYEKYHLAPVSLMLGPGEVDWNLQKFVLTKQYLKVKDKELSKLCHQAYRYGIYSFSAFLLVFVIIIINGVIGS